MILIDVKATAVILTTVRPTTVNVITVILTTMKPSTVKITPVKHLVHYLGEYNGIG